MRASIDCEENNHVHFNASSEPCAPSEAAIATLVRNRTGSPYHKGHVEAWGNTEVHIECRAAGAFAEAAHVSPVRILRDSPRAGEYPDEVGLCILPRHGNMSGSKLQIRKVTHDGEDFLAAFILSGTFVLWGEGEADYTELLPRPWENSELVFEISI